ncbi:MAG: hypothetical protein UH850_08065 [Paludibacteraceae bacterium]|nr:hypothetical protein [Paludibacteraceae bacterium]
MSKKLVLSMLFVYLSTLLSFGKTDDDPIINLETFEIVVLPADTAMGEPNVVHPYKGSDLNIYHIAKPKTGYDVDYWVSKKGLTLDSIADNDTIIVYFKVIPQYSITVISSDTTMGTVTVYGDDIYFEDEKVSLKHDAKEGYKFCCWYSIIDSTKFDDYFSAYRNDTIVGKFIAASDSCPMVYEPNYKLCQIVVLSADTTQGDVKCNNPYFKTGDALEILPIPNYGFVFDHLYSVNGLPTDTVVGNDTIYAYFKELPKYNLTFISEDTTKGNVYGGNGLWYEGKIMEREILFYPHDPALIFEAKNGYHFSYWETNMGNLKDIWDYYLTADDTIILHFEKDTIPEGYLNIYVNRVDTLSLYGNIAICDRHSYNFENHSDSIIVTNKSTGKTDTLPIALQHKYNMNFGDTLLLSIKTNDGYVSDSIYTLVYDDSSRSSLDKEISLYIPMKIIELEEAEGDSFDVHIVTRIEGYSDVIEWKGNGRYAKGDTIEFNEKGDYYKIDNDVKKYYFYKANDSGILSFVVNNNIDLTFWVDAPVGVDQVVAEKESDPFVNVYTINGYMLKHHVKESEALEGLNRGLYIVGRKKVFVNR